MPTFYQSILSQEEKELYTPVSRVLSRNHTAFLFNKPKYIIILVYYDIIILLYCIICLLAKRAR